MRDCMLSFLLVDKRLDVRCADPPEFSPGSKPVLQEGGLPCCGVPRVRKAGGQRFAEGLAGFECMQRKELFAREPAVVDAEVDAVCGYPDWLSTHARKRDGR